jgi:hypothetical protein
VTAEQLLELAYGRPQRSFGWGMLEAKKTKTLAGPGGERIEITAGSSRVARDHWAVRLHPELFSVCDSRDIRSKQAHARALEHVRHELERAAPTARPSGPRRPGVLSSGSSTSPLRLPRPGQAPALKLP